ncbi:hypothetical protein LTR56_003889 [Elasticomyces elasticus]|nr:hypothetical protein LTR22_022564 [Elasticomyces elasticus]KAK3654616.1 hypothetical protein LTR56_003889 [Elasticomyces elasticus]KAK4908004.1 hypothetical protein LTR49_023035 [Elasticomyces elasticus]KAK5755244.1 hypothetical protein LTS12_014694 [Elasticomyces elasticus]
MAPQQSSTPFTPPPSTSKSFVVTKQAKIWFAVAGTIVVVAFAISLWLICSCAWSKKRREQSRMVLDDRNQFPAWNPAVAQEMPPYVEYANGVEMQTPPKAALRQTGQTNGVVHPGEPVVVDEERDAPAIGEWEGERVEADE